MARTPDAGGNGVSSSSSTESLGSSAHANDVLEDKPSAAREEEIDPTFRFTRWLPTSFLGALTNISGIDLADHDRQSIWQRMRERVSPSKPLQGRAVLFAGVRGGGKSTCANAIAGTDKCTEALFASSSACSSFAELETHSVRLSQPFPCELKLIEMPYLSDRDLTSADPISCGRLWQDLEHVAAEGFDHVFFVYSSRFTREDASYFEFLRDVIFMNDELIKESVTLVRTRTNFCMDERKCEEDRCRLERISERVGLITRGVKKVVHVDLPDEFSLNWKEMWKFSREKLLLEVGNNSLSCKLRIPSGLSDRVDQHMVPLHKTREELVAEYSLLEISEISRSSEGIELAELTNGSGGKLDGHGQHQTIDLEAEGGGVH